MTDEKTFYDNNGVLVTNSRLVASGETYAMSGVTSVKNQGEKPSLKGPIVLGVLGLIVVLSSLNSSVVGIVIGIGLIALAVYLWNSKKTVYHVALRTASGESRAYQSTNRDHISDIVKAINDVIVHRG